MNSSVNTAHAANAAAMRDVIGDSLVWDNHVCMPLRPHDRSFMPMLARCRDAGLHLVTLPVGYGSDGIDAHIRMLSMFRDWIAEHTDLCKLVLTLDDAHAAKRDGCIGVCFDIEGMNAIADELDLVRFYYDLRVRWSMAAINALAVLPDGLGSLNRVRSWWWKLSTPANPTPMAVPAPSRRPAHVALFCENLS